MTLPTWLVLRLANMSLFSGRSARDQWRVDEHYVHLEKRGTVPGEIGDLIAERLRQFVARFKFEVAS